MSAPHPVPVVQRRIRGRRATEKAAEENSSPLTVPLIGIVTLPPPGLLAFMGGIALLAALEVIEWPVGLALCAGHVLAACSQNKVIQDFGHALEAA
jgi:hypothetical protein